MIKRTVARWHDWSGAGVEHLELAEDESVIRARSVIVSPQSPSPFALSYRLVCDAVWRTREFDLWLCDGQALSLRGDGLGGWWDWEGKPLDALRGAIDVDLTATPFTNTLPVRRLGLTAGQSADLSIAWVQVPDLKVVFARQRYTCLERPLRYRYESLSSGFMREIELDEAGLVVTYPDLFRRIL